MVDGFFIMKTGQPSNFWMHMSKQSKYMMRKDPQGLRIADQLIRQHNRAGTRGDAEPATPIKEIVPLPGNKTTSKIRDWNVSLGRYGSLHFGCLCDRTNLLRLQPNLANNPKAMQIINDRDANVYTLPVSPASWLIMATKHFLQTTAAHQWDVSFSSNSKKTNWHCAGCYDMYKAGRDLKNRVLHIMNPHTTRTEHRVLVSTPHGTAQHRTAPCRTAPHRAAPHRTPRHLGS